MTKKNNLICTGGGGGGEAADDRGNLVRPISPERGRRVKSKISPARLKCHSVNRAVIDRFRNARISLTNG